MDMILYLTNPSASNKMKIYLQFQKNTNAYLLLDTAIRDETHIRIVKYLYMCN
jgi:hypothetical protein